MKTHSVANLNTIINLTRFLEQPMKSILPPGIRDETFMN